MNLKPYINNFGKVGYEMIFILLGIGFVVLFFYPPLKYSPVKTQSINSLCVYNPPLTSDSFQDDGATYDLLKAKAPILGAQVAFHTNNAKKIKIKGKEREVTETFRENNISNWFTGDGVTDPLWKGLRFVDVTEDAPSKPPGTKFFDIYIKRGAQIPPNLLTFCQNNTVEWKGFISDNNNKSFPPREIDASTIAPWTPGTDPAHNNAPRNGKYYLYAYDTNNMQPVADVIRRNAMPTSSIVIDGNSYNIVYYGGWESKHLRLETTDPVTGLAIGYRYANPTKLAVPEDPYKFLNETKTATDTLQIQAFTPWQIPPSGWWTPECKPAIYLYPKTTMNINVKVKPTGHLTYTDPIYDESTGWNVKAYPTGKLEWLDNVYGINSKGDKRNTNMYDYLYYESKIHDSMIEKPEEGFVVKYEDLENFYHTTLPQLGLNQKETNDYVEYWINTLPKADYYFIGLLSEQNVNQIEPMQIIPSPDSILRVRLYYEALNESLAQEKIKTVKSSQLITNFNREGFSVVEWGGMVKQDKDHPFTCSM
jgi:hypothetical protein